MKQLAANLKTLYQCKKIWFAHLLLMGFYFGLGKSEGLANFDFIAITAFAFINLYYGLTIGILISDLFRKPFLYCLPGQKKSAQLMTLLIWLSMILIFFLISGLFNEDLKSYYNFYLIFIGLLSLNYWLGVALISPRGVAALNIFILSSVIVFPILYVIKSFDPAPILLAALVTIFLMYIILRYLQKRSVGRIENRRLNIIRYKLTVSYSIFILSSVILFPILYAMKSHDPEPVLPAMPEIIFLICIILSYLQFRSIGRIEKRHLCTFTIIIREGIRFSRKEKTHRVIKGFNDFFSGRIITSQSSSFLSHIWAQLYLIFGSFIKNLAGMLIGMLMVIPVLAIFFFIWFTLIKQDSNNDNYIIFLFIFLVSNQFINRQRFNSFLLTSRRVCFLRGIVNLFTSTSISILMVTSFIFIFFIISGSLPHNKWILLICPVILIPVLGALIILLEKNNWGSHIRTTAACAIAVGFWYLWSVDWKVTSIFFTITVSLLAAAIAWGFHLFVLYYDSMKRSLC